jgi:chemotaxis response regulator CheB
VLLTGMGTDGAAGLLAMRRAGGVTLVQDEASCAIFGMPRAAIDLGAAQHVLPPAGIARSLIALHAERVRPSRQ